jgi:hypothetical protein
MVTQNPDGTITVRKEPSKGAANDADAKDAKVKKGLVIPAQVVAPTFPPLKPKISISGHQHSQRGSDAVNSVRFPSELSTI